jgi:hypothetical protein
VAHEPGSASPFRRRARRGAGVSHRGARGQWEKEGLTTAEARRRARIEFGNLDKVKDEVRDVRFGGWAEELGQDLRYSLRVLRRYPGFTAVAVLTLAVGIGANTAIFSVVQALVLGPMAGAGTDRLVSIWAVDGRHAPIPHDFSYPELVDFRARASSFDAVAGRRAAPVGIASGDRTEAGWAELVTTNFFDVLRLEPALGRVFQPEEENDPVAVISHGLW